MYTQFGPSMTSWLIHTSFLFWSTYIKYVLFDQNKRGYGSTKVSLTVQTVY